MGLTNVLGTAMSGLGVTQSSIEIVSQNIANSTTKGYSRKLHDQTYVNADGSNFVRSVEATRSLDMLLQRSVRLETARMAQADARNGLQSQLGLLFGEPGSNVALDTMYNRVVEALEGLAATPESAGTRQEVLQQAAGFAARLNQMSEGVQELRRQAEIGLAEGVREANDALRQIEQLDRQIVMETSAGRVDADLLDQRDMAINALNELMAVRTVQKADGGVTVMTTGGVMLHDTLAAEITFDGRRSVTAQQLYSRDDAARGVGTISAGIPNGPKLDLLSFDGLRGGRLDGFVSMRDEDLVAAQTQLDELAHALAKAVQTTPATTTTDPAFAQHALDFTGFGPGDEIAIDFNGQSYTFIGTGDAGGTALDGKLTARQDLVFALNVTGDGPADWAADIAAQLGIASAAAPGTTSLTAAGNTLTLHLPTANTDTADRFAGTFAKSADGRTGLALFTDGLSPYHNVPNPAGHQQSLGFAGRIAVNQDIVRDPSALVRYKSTAYSGDPTRPQALRDAFDGLDRAYRPAGGVGGVGKPFEGTPSDYIRAVISSQGANTANEARRADAQSLVTQSLVERAERQSGVDIEQEMADLLDLQQIYNANSQVIRVVQELMDQLMNSIR